MLAPALYGACKRGPGRGRPPGTIHAVSAVTVYPARRELRVADFAPESVDRAARYGLPRDVRFCRTCVISNQRPNSAVEYEHTTESAKGAYDCLVPGSGGKDSFYAAHQLRHEFGMHPLTITWAPHIYTDWGWRNFQSWIHAGFDNYLFTPNGRVHRLLTRIALENLFHPFQPYIMGQKSLAPKMAILHKIPLVFYGENEAEYGNPIADMRSAIRDWSYFTADDKSKIFLGG